MGAKANTASSTAACHPETPHKKQGRLSSLLHGMRSSPKQDGHDDAARSDSRTSFESTDTVYALKHGQKSTVSTAAAVNGDDGKTSRPREPMTNMERLAAGYGAWVPERTAVPAPREGTRAKAAPAEGRRRAVSSMDRLLAAQGGWVPEERR